MKTFTEFLNEATEIKLSHNGTTAKIVHEKDGNLLFTSLLTPEDRRNNGDASNVLKQALTYADKQKKDMRLVAIADEDDGDPQRLISFYKKNGFERQEGKPIFMMVRRFDK